VSGGRFPDQPDTGLTVMAGLIDSIPHSVSMRTNPLCKQS